MPKTPEQQAEELFWRIALPSRVATYLGKKVMGRTYNVYPWIAYVEQQIMEMFSRPGREVLVVNICPQEGKTTYAGMWLPFWLIGMRPDDQGILVSYSDEYSTSWGLRVRTLVEQYGEELFGVGPLQEPGHGQQLEDPPRLRRHAVGRHRRRHHR